MAAAARGNQAVELVDEDDGRRDLAGAGEQAGDLLLALAIPFGQQVRGFGGDEIGLGLARGGLGEQGLAGAGRAVEQEALGRADAEPAEGFGVLERQLDAFAQPVARIVEPADIVPADRRRLDHHLAHRRGLDALQRLLEILARHRQRVEHFGRDRALVEVELRHDPPHRLDRRLAHQRGEVGADEAVGLAGEAGDVDVPGERHAAGVDAEDLAAAAFVGHADHDLAVEAAGAAQRLVDRLGPVGRGDDDEILARLQPVEQAQQLGDEALLGLAAGPGRAWARSNRSRR